MTTVAALTHNLPVSRLELGAESDLLALSDSLLAVINFTVFLLSR